jgi:hypothetical protein
VKDELPARRGRVDRFRKGPESDALDGLRPLRAKATRLPRRLAKTPHADTLGAELAALRWLFAAMEAAIMGTALPAARAAMLAVLRSEQTAAERSLLAKAEGRRR